MYAIIITFDNTDPMVVGPFPTREAAQDKVKAVWAAFNDHHTRDVTVTALRSPDKF